MNYLRQFKVKICKVFFAIKRNLTVEEYLKNIENCFETIEFFNGEILVNN